MSTQDTERRKELEWLPISREGHTVIGGDRHQCIVTLVERKIGFVIIRKIRARTVEEVNRARVEAIHEHRMKFISITFDNGTEFHGYKQLEERFPAICYFANLNHSWERGANENTNELIRQYIPKKSCMKNLSQASCDRIAYRLNTRPRKRLGFKTPYEVYYEPSSPLHFLLEPKYSNLLARLFNCLQTSISGHVQNA